MNRLLAFMVMAIMPLSATAAQETGTLITRSAAQIDVNSEGGARRAADAFGACLVARHRGRVAKMIDLPVDSADYARQYRNLFDFQDDPCLSDGQLRMNELIIRSAIFQALYLSEFGKSTTASFPADLRTGYTQLYAMPLSDKARMYLSFENFGECVARADPNASRALLKSAVLSSAENDAIARLQPRLSGCIPKDNTIRMTRSNLRGFIAEGLYRLIRADKAGKQ